MRVHSSHGVAVRWTVLAALLAYAAGLAGPFLFDDGPSLQPVNAWLQGQTSWMDVVFGNRTGDLGRPVSMASFTLSALLGGYHPFAFKLANLLIHIGCGVLLYVLLRRLLDQDRSLAEAAPAVAALVACIWLLHPYQVSTVLYAVQRMSQLAAFFSIAALLAYATARQRLNEGRTGSAARCGFLYFPLLFAFAVLSKENAIVLPAFCLIAEVAWFREYGARGSRFVIAFFVLFLVLPALAGGALLWLHPERLLAGYESRDFDLVERLLTQSRVIWVYVGQLLLPRATAMTLYGDDFDFSTSILSPPTTLVSLLALAAGSAAAYAVRRSVPALFAGWFFFLVGHSIESSAIALELYFEHRNYLPSVGLLLAAVGGLFVALRRRTRSSIERQARAAAVIVLVFLFASTAWLAREWRSSESIARHALRHHPASPRANLSLATAAVAAGDAATAHAAARNLIDAGDARSRSTGLLTRVTLDCIFGQRPRIEDLDAAVSTIPPRLTFGEIRAFDTLYRAASDKRCDPLTPERVADTLERVLDKTRLQSPASTPKWRLRHFLASIQFRLGNEEQALRNAELAWLPGVDVGVGSLLVQLHLKAGRFDQARDVAGQMRARLGRLDFAQHERLDRLEESIERLEQSRPPS